MGICRKVVAWQQVGTCAAVVAGGDQLRERCCSARSLEQPGSAADVAPGQDIPLRRHSLGQRRGMSAYGARARPSTRGEPGTQGPPAVGARHAPAVERFFESLRQVCAPAWESPFTSWRGRRLLCGGGVQIKAEHLLGEGVPTPQSPAPLAGSASTRHHHPIGLTMPHTCHTR